MVDRIYTKIYVFVQQSWAVIIIALSLLIPLHTIENAPSICLFRSITGVRCPGCGMTHSFVSFFHGNISAAISFNFLSVIVIPLIFIIAVKQIIGFVRTKYRRCV